MNAPDPTKAQVISLRELAGTFPALGIGAATLCFSIGLLIVNIRRAQFGVYSMDFLRAEYVLAGALYLFLTAMAGTTAVYALPYLGEGVNKWKARRHTHGVAKILQALIYSLAPFGIALPLLSQYRFLFFSWEYFIALACLFLQAISARSLVATALLAWRTQARRTTDVAANDLMLDLDLGMHKIIALLSALVLYSYFLYPKLSPAFGGGFRTNVYLVPTATGAATLRDVGIPSQSNGTHFGPVQVLTSSDQEVTALLLLEEGRFFPRYQAFHLSRGMLQAVVGEDTGSPRSPDALPAPKPDDDLAL
ncbi:MAG: hypothetical protein ACKVQA_01850 [Burkholderiales bacterium]